MGGRERLLVAADVSEIRCIQHYFNIHDQTRLRFALSFGLQDCNCARIKSRSKKLASCNDDSNYWFYSLPSGSLQVSQNGHQKESCDLSSICWVHFLMCCRIALWGTLCLRSMREFAEYSAGDHGLVWHSGTRRLRLCLWEFSENGCVFRKWRLSCWFPFIPI